jgi:plastocyanin
MQLNLSLLGALGLVSIAAAITINVDVGESGLMFDPSTITADVGDEIAFDVYPPHSVTEGNGFDHPCEFKPGGFFSGFSSTKQTFTIKVADTKPIWLYCSQISHCQAGMVAVINPP